MKRLTTALVCFGLAFALFSLAGGYGGLVALASGRAWHEAGLGWVCRIPDVALFGLLGVALGGFLIAVGRKA